MSKELEALKGMYFRLLNLDLSIASDDYDMIEAALKEHTKIKELFEKFGIEDVYNLEVRLMNYELGEKILKNYGLTLADFRRACFTYAQFKNCKADKNLKALEIIKEKRVNLEYLKCCENYEQYKTVCSYWNEITQEDFDLLKEVL